MKFPEWLVLKCFKQCINVLFLSIVYRAEKIREKPDNYFINYTPDKLLKMYCCYFVFFLRLSPCVFHVPSDCTG